MQLKAKLHYNHMEEILVDKDIEYVQIVEVQRNR